MRLERLALERYGRFTGREIAFAPDARLHVVFGPNEAGKTTALQAVGDLLYGIEERTRFNFLHPNDDLRIGAELKARDGRRIAFRRRKGRGNTLIDAQDRPLADATLEPWLAGVSREVFRHTFGLSQDGLRQGGEAMLAADGEVGRSLFAAASGLTGLAELSRALKQESEALFKKSSRGATRFDQLNQAYDKARRTARERSLAFESWRELSERIAGLESRADDIRKRRAGIAAERAMLERLRRVAPLLARIDRAEQQVMALAELPELPPGFDRRIFACLQTLEKVERDAREQAEMLAEIEARLARIPREPALLAEGERIDGLVERLQTLREAARDVPGQEMECSEAEALLENYARRLGLTDVGELARSEPSDAVRERARKLIADGAALQATASDLRRQREDLQVEISAAQTKCESFADARDLEPLRRRLVALRPELAALAAYPELAADIEHRKATLAERAARLDPAIPLDTLAHCRLPSAEAVREFATEATTLARQATELAARRQALTETMAKEQHGQSAIAGGAGLPTPEAIATARATRDRLWDEARDLVLPDAAPRVRDAADRTRLAGDLDLAIRDADMLADRRDAEGDRLARHHETARRVDETQVALDRLVQQESDLARRRSTHEESWEATWADLDIAPRAPNEMLRWLDGAARLIGEREALAAEAAKLDALAMREAALVPVLAALAGDLGLEAKPLPLAVWARDLELAIEAAAGRWQAAREAARDLDKARLALTRMAEAEQHHEDASNAWRGAWREAMPAIGLRLEASDEEARAALAAWSQIPQARTRRDISRRRVSAMKQTLAENFAVVADIAGRLAPDLAAADPIISIEALRDRLSRARALDTEAAQVAAEQARARDRHADVQRRLADAMAERDALVRVSGIADPAGLESLATRIRERSMTHAALAILRSDLAEQGEGFSEVQLRAERDALSGDAAAERAAASEDEDRRLVDELAGAQAAVKSALQERDAFESGRGAELAAQEQAAAEAGLAELARNYALLQAACLLVTAAIERHRARYQDPLIARASALFAQVTGTGFSGLALDYRDTDTLSLVAERPDGRRVPIAGLSEGSRDQLYLALRLAALAELAARSDPLPFVCDDLLVSFDDARAALALQALAAAGETIQVILFTHHRHIVTLAQSKLRNAVDLIEL